MSLAEIIVCESTSHWATFWRRGLVDVQSPVPRVRECRDLAECDTLLAQYPASLVAVEAAAVTLQQTARWIAGLERRFPHARAVALLQQHDETMYTLLREAGALTVVTSAREIPAAVALARRHLARAPRSHQSRQTRIWASLPWADAATVSSKE